MEMSASVRRLVLTAHVTVSVGWIGALAGFLVLAIFGVVSDDALTVRSCYLAMDVVNRFVVVPAALLALGTGIIQAMGTPWGLLRHYWVVLKLVIIAAATVLLLGKTGAISEIARISGESALAGSDLWGLRLSILGHAVGGLAVLLWAMVLGMYKPRALTPLGQRAGLPGR
jgi:hypothetical protein